MAAAHYIRYRVEGLNRNNLINSLKKNGITLYKIAEKGTKVTEFSISAADKQKFFAITENLCYNITRIREYGFLYPIIRLFGSAGLIIGALLFFAVAAVADKAVLQVDYYGSGAVYKEEADAVLYSLGIKKFSFVTDSDLRTAETEILKSTDRFSFAALKKHGARLKVNLVLSPETSGIIDTSRKAITAPVGGVVESVKVYRGTALVAAGDTVEAGAVLVEGFNEIKDTRVETYVLGTVTLIAEYSCVYDCGEEQALLLARESIPGYEVVEEFAVGLAGGTTAVTLKYRIKVT